MAVDVNGEFTDVWEDCAIWVVAPSTIVEVVHGCVSTLVCALDGVVITSAVVSVTSVVSVVLEVEGLTVDRCI